VKWGELMAYVALYREWRPKTFHDIIGQEHITRTLKNQIEQGRISHAYLLCGTHGTGKTTTAKVFARAVNCLSPVDIEPCGKCEICLGIDNGNIMDIVEIDAASNNGVDNIRELKEDVKYLPSKCKYKVYIIDEVHMLSTGAFNALLKTLEEPPAHVIFILATTAFQKVPATIVSRCQRFDFKRIRMEDIVKRLRSVASEGSVNVEDRTLNLIARNSDGALRDALSIFDQCISLNGSDISYKDVVSILGVAGDEYLIKISEAIGMGNTSGCISLIDEAVMNGKDVYQFIKDLTAHFRNLMVCKIGDNALNILNIPEEIFRELNAQAKKLSTESILRNINILSAADSDAKWSSQQRIILEMAVLRMCKKELCTDTDALLERISRLEEALSKGIAVAPAQNIKVQVEETAKKSINREQIKKAERVQEKVDGSSNTLFQDISKKWKDILKSVSSSGHKRVYAFMLEGKLLNYSDGILTVGFEKNYEFHKKGLENPESKKLAEEYISSACGSNIGLRCIMQDEIAADKQEEDIVEKARRIFGEDLVEVEE